MHVYCMHVHCMHVHCMHCGQVGGHVKLRTLPQCYNCGEDTQFDWRACPYCLYTTKKRKKVEIERKGGPQKPPKTSASGQSTLASPATQPEADGDHDKDWAAPDFQLKASEAKKQILDHCDPELTAWEKEQVFVHIVDISHGRRTTVRDPHDRTRMWKTFDPLDYVGFFNPKTVGEGQAEPEIMQVPKGGWSTQVPEIFLPAAVHMKTLYCYLRMSQREAEDAATRECLQERVEAAIEAWKTERKVGPQLGTSNATPSRCSSRNPSQQASQQPSAAGTPCQPEQNGSESRGTKSDGKALDVLKRMDAVAEGEE